MDAIEQPEGQIMASARTLDPIVIDLTRRAAAARGYAPARQPRRAPPVNRLVRMGITTAAVSVATLLGLLFYGAVLGF